MRELSKPVDRSKFPRGPWDEEPDDAVPPWEAHGLRCYLLRNTLGTWCGYVDVPAGHVCQGMPLEVIDDVVGVHGGVTYASAEGPDWTIGFDCGHHGDLTPGLLRNYSPAEREGIDALWGKAVYRTREWTKAETERLAEQLARFGARADAARELLEGLDKLIDSLVCVDDDSLAMGSMVVERLRQRVAARRAEATKARDALRARGST